MSASHVIPMLLCKISELHVVIGDAGAPDDDIQLQINTQFSPVDDREGRVCGLDMSMDYSDDREAFYSIGVTSRILFEFDDDMTDEERLDYLGSDGATRLLDATRLKLEAITSNFAYGMLPFPPISTTVDAKEWKKQLSATD